MTFVGLKFILFVFYLYYTVYRHDVTQWTNLSIQAPNNAYLIKLMYVFQVWLVWSLRSFLDTPLPIIVFSGYSLFIPVIQEVLCTWKFYLLGHITCSVEKICLKISSRVEVWITSNLGVLHWRSFGRLYHTELRQEWHCIIYKIQSKFVYLLLIVCVIYSWLYGFLQVIMLCCVIFIIM